MSVVLVFHIFRSPAIDYRWIVLGAVLPVAEAALGGPRLLHTLIGSVGALALAMIATRRRRLLRRQLLGVPIGMFVHLVLDGIWARSSVFWWPFLGTSFGSAQVPELTRGWMAVVLELAGLAALAWSWRAFGLADPARRRSFLRSGHLALVAGPVRPR